MTTDNSSSRFNFRNENYTGGFKDRWHKVQERKLSCMAAGAPAAFQSECSGQIDSLSLSLRFNGHFPGQLGLAGVYWSKGWWRWWWQLNYWSYKSCKAPVKSSPPTNQHPVFLQTGCPSCRPTNSVKALKGKISHSMDLLNYPKLTWGLPT